jgi:adenylate cyclase
MPVEIERKFLVVGEGWRSLAQWRQRFRQGYLSRGPGTTVRVRLAGQAAFLTVKGDGLIARAEFEYAIPAEHAEAMLANLCEPPLIEKTRHEVWHAGLLWQVDEFHGDSEGLVVAEVELRAADQAVELPDWVGREVTGDMAYRNSELSRRPDGARAAPSPPERAPPER